jgi:putative membrane protein
MIQILFSLIASIFQWIIAILDQIIILLAQLMGKPKFSQGAQWVLKNLMEDSMDSTKDWFKHTFSHLYHSIKYPHPPFTRTVQILILVSLPILVWCAYIPRDRYIWFLEITPICIIVLFLLGFFYRQVFTDLFYYLFFLQVMWVMIGAHYTYQTVPLGEWLRNALVWDRNPFDRIGHFIQGVVTFVFAREILYRTSPLKKSKWLNFSSLCITLTMSVIYEFYKWGVVLTIGETKAAPFVNNQGDIWNAQWNMLLALLGGLTSLVLLCDQQDRQLKKLNRYLTTHKAEKK